MTGLWWVVRLLIRNNTIDYSIVPSRDIAQSTAIKILKDNPIIENIEIVPYDQKEGSLNICQRIL